MQSAFSGPCPAPPQHPTPPLFIPGSGTRPRGNHDTQGPHHLGPGPLPPVFPGSIPPNFPTASNQPFMDTRAIHGSTCALPSHVGNCAFGAPYSWPMHWFEHQWLLNKGGQCDGPTNCGAYGQGWDALYMCPPFDMDAYHRAYGAVPRADHAYERNVPPEAPHRAAANESSGEARIEGKPQNPTKRNPCVRRTPDNGKRSKVGGYVEVGLA